MINPKIVTTAAIIGFCFSFLIGLIFGVRFSHILLRAVIFAVIFAALAVVVSIVYDKFLSTSNSFSDLDSSTVSSGSTNSGSMVNITIDDEPLPDDDYAPKFTVENNRQALGVEALTKDSEKSENSQPENISPNGNTQSANLTPSENSVESAEFKTAALNDITKKQENTSSSVTDVLDDLPDISNLASENSLDSSDSTVSSVASDGSSSSSQNAKLMAQTIRTVLLKEDS